MKTELQNGIPHRVSCSTESLKWRSVVSSSTTDALVNCECCGKGNNPLQACEDDKFCLRLTDGTVDLKQTRIYYKQVQTRFLLQSHTFVT